MAKHSGAYALLGLAVAAGLFLRACDDTPTPTAAPSYVAPTYSTVPTTIEAPAPLDTGDTTTTEDSVPDTSSNGTTGDYHRHGDGICESCLIPHPHVGHRHHFHF
jgi:hypothetical protein